MADRDGFTQADDAFAEVGLGKGRKEENWLRKGNEIAWASSPLNDTDKYINFCIFYLVSTVKNDL